EAVVARIGHRRVEKAVDHQYAAVLVHFILDWLAADGDLDDDVHVFRGVIAYGNCFDSHANDLDRGCARPSGAGPKKGAIIQEGLRRNQLVRCVRRAWRYGIMRAFPPGLRWVSATR